MAVEDLLFPLATGTDAAATLGAPCPRRTLTNSVSAPGTSAPAQDPTARRRARDRPFDWKLEQLKKHGFDAMMFHDDDAVPDIDGKSRAADSQGSEGVEEAAR